MNRYYRTIAALLTALICCASQSVALPSPSSSVRASVVDMQTRQLLSEVRVSAFTLHGTDVLATALTDTKGEFTLEGLRGGLYRIELAKHGYHLAVVAGLYVKTAERMVITGPIGMYSGKVHMPETEIARDSCRDLVLPGQTGDVYVVCNQTR